MYVALPFYYTDSHKSNNLVSIHTAMLLCSHQTCFTIIVYYNSFITCLLFYTLEDFAVILIFFKKIKKENIICNPTSIKMSQNKSQYNFSTSSCIINLRHVWVLINNKNSNCFLYRVLAGNFDKRFSRIAITKKCKYYTGIIIYKYYLYIIVLYRGS